MRWLRSLVSRRAEGELSQCAAFAAFAAVTPGESAPLPPASRLDKVNVKEGQSRGREDEGTAAQDTVLLLARHISVTHRT